MAQSSTPQPDKNDAREWLEQQHPLAMGGTYSADSVVALLTAYAAAVTQQLELAEQRVSEANGNAQSQYERNVALAEAYGAIETDLAAVTQERDALCRENALHENELIKLYEEATHHLKTIALARELFKGSKFFAPIEDALRAAAEESQPK